MTDRKILIVKNITREGPGLLEGLLRERGIGFDLADLDQGEKFPPVYTYAAIVVLGGPDSANDENPKIQQELARIREAVAARIPYLGICLGLQVLVKAAGGAVVTSPTKEVGFRAPDDELFQIELTAAGVQSPLFAGLKNHLKVFHLHGETVELSDGMTLLAEGRFCRNQAVRVGENAYGLQCHFEVNTEMFESWISQDPDLLQLDKQELRADFASIYAEYKDVGEKLLTNFLAIAGFE